MVGIGDIIKGIYNSETKVEVLARLGAIAHHDDNDKYVIHVWIILLQML